MDQEILKNKKELGWLIDSYDLLKHRCCLSGTGLMYLEGLKVAYDKIFPMEIEEGKE